MLSIFIFSKVVEEVLWRLTLIHRDIFVADTTMAEMVSDIPALACFGQEGTLPRFLKYLYPWTSLEITGHFWLGPYDNNLFEYKRTLIKNLLTGLCIINKSLSALLLMF